jgi:RHS repeat-associated protein
MHRLTSIKYAGPNATEGNRYLVYDAATVSGVAMANAAGQVAEAYTCCDSKGNKMTDLGFSYSVRGEVTDVYESTPNSGGYYHTTATYFANGVLNALGGVPGQAAWTFGVDGEGRPNSTAQGTTTLVSSVSYNAASEPLQINYGTGDFDKYTYDSKTALMTYFTFSVGATPKTLVGNLSWNKNGTLRALATTDGFNTANSQNCTYLYDDLIRAKSAQCASAWGQTFSYDAFGNIQKSGSSSFQATYTPTTNRIASLPGVAVAYDADGNLTSDGTHTYSWSAENHQTAVGSTSVLYDALNRPIEITSGSAHAQILYSPIGKLGIMNGQTSKSIYLPLPGGASINYTGGSEYVRHSDWLGAARLITQLSTRVNQYDSAFAPFGENYAGLGTSQLDFTGQTQDTTSGLYDFTYREYSPVQSRWIAPDPSGTDVVDSTNPQTWNRYAYLKNNPLSDTDPLGLDDCLGDVNFCVDFSLVANPDTTTVSSSWFYWGGGLGDSSSDIFFSPGSMAQQVFSNPVFPQANYFVNGATFVVGGALAVPAAIAAAPVALAVGTGVAHTATTYYYAAVPAAYAVNALFCELCQGQGFPSITQEWPAGNGFLGGVSQTVIAKPGQLLSRIGSTRGGFVANVGESIAERGLPANYQPAVESMWKVVRPFQMQGGMARPWNGAVGYGVQYLLPRSIDFLRVTGKIKPFKQ